MTVITATRAIEIRPKRFYKSPASVAAEPIFLFNGSTLEFENNDQLLRALAGELETGEIFTILTL